MAKSSRRPTEVHGPGETPLVFGPDTERQIETLDRLRQTVEAVADALQKKMAPGALKADEGAKNLAGTITKGLTAGVVLAANSFRSLFGELASGFGVAQNQLTQLAAAANPAAAVQLDRAFKSFSYTLGQILQPVVEFASGFLRELADRFYNLSPAVKAVVAGTAVFTVALAALIPVASVATVAFLALGEAVGFATAGLSIAAALLATAAAGAAAGIGYLATTTGKLAGVVEPLREAASQLLDVLEELIDSGIDALLDVTAAVAPVLREFARAIRDIVRDLGPLLPELVKAAVYIAAFAAALSVAPLVAMTSAVAGLTSGFRLLAGFIGEASRQLGLFGAAVDSVLFGGAGVALEKLMGGAGGAKVRQPAPPGPATVRATTAEEFSREMRRSALTASFGAAAPKDPQQETAQNTAETARAVDELRDMLKPMLLPLADYARRAGGQ